MPGITSAEDPWWLEPYPDALLEDVELGPEARYDARESIALSFVAGLQHLPVQQRAVLVLRDVLGFTAAEVADILDTKPTSVNSALIRARSGFRPDRSPDTVPSPRSAEETAVVDRFVDAFQRGDLTSIVALLTDDARLSMPPEPIQCNGPVAIVAYLRARGFWGPQLSLVATRANGQPAFGYYLPDPNNTTSRANGLIVLTIAEDRISTLTRFGGNVVQRFGLPATMPSGLARNSIEDNAVTHEPAPMTDHRRNPRIGQTGDMWWLAHSEADVPSSLEWLSRHERDHLESIRYTKRRDEYMTRRWTAKQAIATVLDLDRSLASLTRIEVRHRESGAPYAQLDGEMADVDVSMSDRAGWAVCLVGPPGSAASGTLGIDLEVVEPRSAAFVDDFFTPAERRFVHAIDEVDRRHEAANLIWSAKEAALKVQQVGLRVDTRTVEVHLTGTPRADGWSAMTVIGRDGAMPGWWRRDGVFLLTIACDSHREPPSLLPTGSNLAAAEPLHSWVNHPIC